MAYIFSDAELQAARERISMVIPDPDPDPTPAPAPAPAPVTATGGFQYTPRSEEQWHKRARQSWQGDAKEKAGKSRKSAPAPASDPVPTSFDALISAANDIRRICGALAERDYAALRQQVADLTDLTDGESFRLLREDFPSYLSEIMESLGRVRAFMLAIDPRAAAVAEATAPAPAPESQP